MADHHPSAPAYSPDSYNNYQQQPQQHQPMSPQGQEYGVQHQQQQQQQYHQQPQPPMPTYNSYSASTPPAHDEKAQHQQSVHPVMSPPQQYASMSPQHSNIGAAGAGAQHQPQLQHQGSQYQTAVPLQGLGMAPAPVDCPACHRRALTRVERHAGNTTHGWAFATCCLTGCLCFIPYLMDSLKDVDHHCGNCGTRLAKWHKSGNVEVFVHA